MSRIFRVLQAESGNLFCHNKYSDEYFIKYSGMPYYLRTHKTIYLSKLHQVDSSYDIEDLDEDHEYYIDTTSGKFRYVGMDKYSFDVSWISLWELYGINSTTMKFIKSKTDKDVLGYYVGTSYDDSKGAKSGIAKSLDEVSIFSTLKSAKHSLRCRKGNVFDTVYSCKVSDGSLYTLDRYGS